MDTATANLEMCGYEYLEWPARLNSGLISLSRAVQMFSQLFVAVYLALFTAATPLTVRKNSVTVSLARRINVIGSKTFVELDKARAKSLMRSATQ
ncbi:uncharacterized protein PHACADRAFT_214958, partial [Phanerochaete carnosa HHB-10118-sp]